MRNKTFTALEKNAVQFSTPLLVKQLLQLQGIQFPDRSADIYIHVYIPTQGQTHVHIIKYTNKLFLDIKLMDNE